MLRRFSIPILCLAIAQLSVIAAEPTTNFSSILRQETRSTFRKVADYLNTNPQAADAPQAWKWLFTTAIDQRLEDEAIPFAEQYLKSEKPDPFLKAAAQQTLMFGLARAGKGEAAVDLFQQQLRFARLQNGRELADFSLQLATALRVGGNFEASKTVFEETANKFFLDGDIRAMCENKVAKLGLINKPAPAINAADSKGNAVSLTDLKGKVVIVDFWATNCGPCIEEFPNLKSLYNDLNPKGLEIIGISLDGDPGLVDAFSQRLQLPWRMIVTENVVEQLRQEYFVRKIPSLYIVAQDGDVVQYDVKGSDLRETVQKLLTK